MTFLDHLLVLAFAILYPIYAYFAYRKIKADLVADKPGIRVHDYKETTAWLWFLAIAALVAWKYQGRSLLDLGLGLPSAWPALLGLLLIGLLSGFLAIQLRKLGGDEELRRGLGEQLDRGSVSEFLPRTRQELRWFILLSITAGVCEEILFRGFLIWYFSQFSATAVAVVLSAIVFGLAHSYQGWQGSLRAGVMGLVLAVSYVLTGSLWVPIFLHIAGDIYAGTLGWLAYAEDGPDPS